MTSRPETPSRRASSARLSSFKTPASQSRTPNVASRLGGSEQRTNALTPHGRAAFRELEARRAGMTPGKDRRRSGRQQRETPRDILRLLSRTLAPQTLPTVPSPKTAPTNGRKSVLIPDDENDDDASLVPPRLSLPLDEEDEEDDNEDDESLLLPSFAPLEDENLTARSIELPRRAINERLGGRFSRGSFGSIRMSDRFADLDEEDLGRDAMQSSFLIGNELEGENFLGMGNSPYSQTDQTGTNLFNPNLTRRSLLPGRSSDIRPYGSSPDERDATFLFTIPQPDDIRARRESSQPPVDSPEHVPEESMLDIEPPQGQEIENTMLSSSPLEGPHLSSSRRLSSPPDQSVLEPLRTRAVKKTHKLSKHGLKYSSLPLGVVKKLATTFARNGSSNKTKLSKDTLDALMQASDWFFEQISDDLGAYAEHAGRKTIDESDVLTLMKRQRQTNATTTPFSLAQSHLPRELLQDLRMAPPVIPRGRRRKPPSG